MTDKPQELDEILNQLVSKTADASYGEWEVVGLPEAKQAILNWHNKQMSELDELQGDCSTQSWR